MIFTEEQKRKAWERAQVIPGYNPQLYRKDACGAWIAWNKYGKQDNIFGWEIDHIFPVEKGGDDNSTNLWAMQHQNNASKSDDYPTFRAKMVAEGNTNVHKDRSFIVNSTLRNRLKQLYKDA